MESHSGVAYSGWLPTSRYRRAPFSRKTLLLRPQLTTRRNRYRATSSGDSRRWPRRVHVTPYSFSRPKIRRSIEPHGTVQGVEARRMVHLTMAAGSFHARVLAARLGADGILTGLRGSVDGPYPVVSEVEVLVPVDDLDVARELLLTDEVEAA